MNKLIAPGAEVTGKPIDRVDGKLKVTGKAQYSAEFSLPGLLHGVAVISTIARGHIDSIDSSTAKKTPGVKEVMTYKNAMSLHFPPGSDPGAGKYAEKDLLPLQGDRIFYDGQVVAVVIADTLEVAELAASLVKVTYRPEEAMLDFEKEKAKAYKPKAGLGGQPIQQQRGDIETELKKTNAFKQTYTTPVYHHNAMEPHATIAAWEGEKLLVYDATQSVYGTKTLLSNLLGIEPDKVRVISLFIGGGFGSKGFSWPNTVLTAMASKLVSQPVKLVLSRQQMFSTAGRRSQTEQSVSLAADSTGKLSGLQHHSITESSFVDEFVEPCGVGSIMIYDAPNAAISQELLRLNKGTPCPMRAPGEATGSFALEVAMDELAAGLKIDPVAFRIINDAARDPQKHKPFSSKNLNECFEKGKVLIGWEARNPVPGSMKEGNFLVGYGMATATYPANRSASAAKAILTGDGRVTVECATQDIGTGTYTVMTQIAADALGLPVEQITMKLGDSDFPKAANSGGSQVSASVGPAVRAACLGLLTKLTEMAIADTTSPLYGIDKALIGAKDGRLVVIATPDKGEELISILQKKALGKLEASAETKASTRPPQAPEPEPMPGSPEEKIKKESKTNEAVQEDEKVARSDYSFHSFGAHFVKVLVDPDLMTVRVSKVVGVMDIGTVLNMKTAKNQIMGGMIFGIGMALMEETRYDPVRGRVVTRDLSNYLVPVHADMPEFVVEFLEKPDPVISPIGARGIGEIGITGMSAAVANAIYHATGKRVRDLPITPDKLLS